jgi:hypothetical protein
MTTRPIVTTTNQHWYLDKYSQSRLSLNNSSSSLNKGVNATGLLVGGMQSSERLEWDH